jgi:hypothetical protein
MKGLQWNKLDHRKLEGTIFESFGDQPELLRDIDFKDVEKSFAALIPKVVSDESASTGNLGMNENE